MIKRKVDSQFDSDSLTRQMLEDLRGKRTQKKMSELLGHSFNQWHKWESGQKILMWSDFKKIALLLKINLTPAMQMILNSEDVSIEMSGKAFLKKILETFGGLDSVYAKEKITTPRSTLYRMMSTKKEATQDVSVSFIFQCLGELSTTIPFFLTAIIKDISNAKINSPEVSRINQQVSLEGKFPWLSAIEAILELDVYLELKNHSDKIIANELGLSIAEVKKGLKILLENEMIFIENNKYKLTIKRLDLTTLSDSAKFAAFWTKICAKRFNTSDSVPLSRQGWGSRVFPVSDNAYEKINLLRKKFYNDVTKILQSDGHTKKKKVAVLIIHFFDHYEFKKIKFDQ